MAINLKPNHTQIPNYYLDVLMPELSPPEWKVLCYITRRTFGFQKRSDRISLTQMEKGITTKDGKVLDRGTGLTRKTIIKSLDTLISMGVITVDKKKMTNVYKVVEKIHQSKVVEEIHYTSGGNTLEVVEELHTQKKGKESIQKKVILQPTKSSADIVSVIEAFSKFNPVCKRYYGNKTQRGASQRLVENYGLPQVLKIIETLPKTNGIKYMPVATTPMQLENKWMQLAAAVQKEFNSQPQIF